LHTSTAGSAKKSKVTDVKPLSLDPDLEPLSLDPDPQPRRLLYPIAIVIIAAIIGVIAGIVYSRSKSDKDSSSNSTEPEPLTVAVQNDPKPIVPKKTTPLPAPTKKTENIDKKAANPSPMNKKVLPKPVKQGDDVKEPEIGPEPREVVVKPAPPPMPKEGEVVVNGEIEQINLPQGEFVIDSLNDDTHRILRGEVKTLRIGGVGGKVVIDASQLKAKRIVVTGAVESEGLLKLHAPEGIVEFRGKVEGIGRVEIVAPKGTVRFVEPTAQGQDGSKIDGSGKVSVTAQTVELHGKVDGSGQLNIDAPDGTVCFAEATEGGREGSKIGGGAKVNITARELDFRGRLDGGAEIRVTLTSAGKIRCKEMDGGAKLYYHKSKPTDPEPIIEPGELKGGAKIEHAP
jgi:hypothetical protein